MGKLRSPLVIKELFIALLFFPNCSDAGVLGFCARFLAEIKFKNNPITEYVTVHYEPKRVKARSELRDLSERPVNLRSARLMASIDNGKLTLVEKDQRTAISTSDFEILNLKSIGGTEIPVLEKALRPDVHNPQNSRMGLIGINESVLPVLAEDYRVVRDMGLTHADLGAPLHAIEDLVSELVQVSEYDRLMSDMAHHPSLEFKWHGDIFELRFQQWTGAQRYPLLETAGSARDYVLTNKSTGKTIVFSQGHPELLNYGFYEGRGTAFRLDPRDIVEMFPELRMRVKTALPLSSGERQHETEAIADMISYLHTPSSVPPLLMSPYPYYALNYRGRFRRLNNKDLKNLVPSFEKLSKNEALWSYQVERASDFPVSLVSLYGERIVESDDPTLKSSMAKLLQATIGTLNARTKQSDEIVAIRQYYGSLLKKLGP